MYVPWLDTVTCPLSVNFLNSIILFRPNNTRIGFMYNIPVKKKQVVKTTRVVTILDVT